MRAQRRERSRRKIKINKERTIQRKYLSRSRPIRITAVPV
jgi:hypothetical protein